MKHLWNNVQASRLAVAAALSAVPCFLTASCAETNDNPELPPNEASTIPSPDGGGSDGGDGATEPVACGGTDWCIVPTGVNPLYVLKAVWGAGKNDVWAAGSGGAIAHFDGSKWSALPSSEKTTINAIWGSGPEDVYLVGSVDAIFHTSGMHGETATFTDMPLPGGGPRGMGINTVWGTSASDVRLGTSFYDYSDLEGNAYQGNQFVLTQGDGGAPVWQSSTTGPQWNTLVRSIWGASREDFWVAGSQPDMKGREALMFHARVNGGKVAFSEVDSQSSSPLESIHGTSAKDVWAVGAGGTIRHITDTDTRWQEVASPTTKTLHAVWASAPDDVWAVGDDFTILHYDGKSFTLAAAELPADRKPALYGIWGSGRHDIWVVGDAVTLHYTGANSPGEGR
jgi:photosystem II stability/assembly factor-like uncharacterized protein